MVANAGKTDTVVADFQEHRVGNPSQGHADPLGLGMAVDIAQRFLRDAEQALAQRRFDAAKTFVDSARRIDPNSAQAALMLRRIKDQELQYLREETSIK